MSDIQSYNFSFIGNVQAQRSAEAAASAGGKGNGSYLMALAIMLGEIADKMLDKVMDLANQLDNIQDQKADIKNEHLKDNGDVKKGKGARDPGSMGENKITAELQAQTQIMNMFMQAMSTVIKSVGEANRDVARKQ